MNTHWIAKQLRALAATLTGENDPSWADSSRKRTHPELDSPWDLEFHGGSVGRPEGCRITFGDGQSLDMGTNLDLAVALIEAHQQATADRETLKTIRNTCAHAEEAESNDAVAALARVRDIADAALVPVSSSAQ